MALMDALRCVCARVCGLLLVCVYVYVWRGVAKTQIVRKMPSLTFSYLAFSSVSCVRR